MFKGQQHDSSRPSWLISKLYALNSFFRRRFSYLYIYIYIFFFFFFFFFMVPASRPDCKLRWNIERERVQKNTGERGLDKLNFCQTTLVIFSCHGIFPLKSLDRLQLLPWGAGGGKFLMKLCNGITGKSSYKIIYFRVLEVIWSVQ